MTDWLSAWITNWCPPTNKAFPCFASPNECASNIPKWKVWWGRWSRRPTTLHWSACLAAVTVPMLLYKRRSCRTPSSTTSAPNRQPALPAWSVENFGLLIFFISATQQQLRCAHFRAGWVQSLAAGQKCTRNSEESGFHESRISFCDSDKQLIWFWFIFSFCFILHLFSHFPTL